MAGFSPELLEEIRSRLDIVEVVGQFVGLKRAGVNWKGLCPFHTEKTPSFTVNPKRGIFHCFGCNAGGDAFSFLMRHDRLGFPEAVRTLAERAGVELPSAREPEADGRFEALRRTMALAAEFYAQCLWEPSGSNAREYLARRGVDLEVARRFGLGYAPEGWNALLTAMARHSIADDHLVQAGLVLPRQTGSGFYDRFRGRLLFPIRDLQGRVIAFGGRALGHEEPKYLNSPETPLYVKGQTLYALDVARHAVREKSRAIIVEGYLDCLMAHQHGFTETVASLGTAVTEAQLGLLRRYSDEVIALFDADAAGQKASARLEEMMSEGMDLQNLGWSVSRTGGFERPGSVSVRVAILPPGHDPDSLLRAEGATALAARLETARPLLAFVLGRALQDEDLTTTRGRAAAHARVALLLSKVSSAEEATALAREAARRLGVDATQLWIEAQQLQGARGRGRRFERPAARAADPGSTAPWPPPNLAERDLLALLLHVDEARTELLSVLEDADVTHPGLRTILGALRGASGRPEAMLSEVEDERTRGLLAALLMEERAWDDAHSQISELRKRYHIRHRKKQIRQVSEAIAHAQTTRDPALPALEEELRQLQREAEAVRELALARPEPEAGSKPGR
ncbi:MAG TPA: DNA primase [Methylomirabilota bacterium]|jgi:DNA primase|nr:DNA primase [Methylomirabilota bacterium]